MNNPDLMAAAQQFMGGGGINPSMLGQLGNNPALAQMAQQFMGNPGMMAAAQGMLGQAGTPSPSPALAQAPTPAPTPAPAPAPQAAAAAGGEWDGEDVPEAVLVQAVLQGLIGPDPNAV